MKQQPNEPLTESARSLDIILYFIVQVPTVNMKHLNLGGKKNYVLPSMISWGKQSLGKKNRDRGGYLGNRKVYFQV